MRSSKKVIKRTCFGRRISKLMKFNARERSVPRDVSSLCLQYLHHRHLTSLQ